MGKCGADASTERFGRHGGSIKGRIVRFSRKDGEHSRPVIPPTPLFDAWLIKKFPGKTLEELDQIDYGRLMQALEAEWIEHVEDRRVLQMAGKIEFTEMEAYAIEEHEELLMREG